MSLNQIIFKKFRNAFENKCFRLIIDAYQTSLSKEEIRLDWNENDISFVLYEKIEDNPRRIEKYKIHISPEFRILKKALKTKGFADKLPRVDLRMSHFAIKKEIKYFFEAKRLKEKDSKLKRAYINEGMDRFISKKYPSGCMLGYLLEGNTEETVKGINFLLENGNRKTEILKPKPNKLHKNYYESVHSKIGILKHLIFDFTKM